MRACRPQAEALDRDILCGRFSNPRRCGRRVELCALLREMEELVRDGRGDRFRRRFQAVAQEYRRAHVRWLNEPRAAHERPQVDALRATELVHRIGVAALDKPRASGFKLNLQQRDERRRCALRGVRFCNITYLVAARRAACDGPVVGGNGGGEKAGTAALYR